MTFLETLKQAGRKRAAYHRTIHEIRAMRQDTAIDLGIFKEDADKIARKAIYG